MPGLYDGVTAVRNQSDVDYKWRSGDTDEYGVKNCKKRQLNNSCYYVWSEEITKKMYDNPKEWEFGFDGKHLYVVDVIEAQSPEDALSQWMASTSTEENKIDPRNERDFLIKRNSKYYHIFIDDEDKDDIIRSVNAMLEDW